MSEILTKEEALRRVAAYCAAAEHCIAEVEDKLHRWKIDSADCNEIIERLLKENFIDEQRYCKAFVRDKFRFAKWGRMKIRQALFVKHIQEKYINEALALLSETDYQETLEGLIEAKRKTLKKIDNPYEVKNKLMRFALSRGFESECIWKCLGDDD